MPSHILGISAYYHDSAAALVVDGRVIAAAQEERFTRKKHDPRFPLLAIRYCLDQAGAKASDLDHVVFYEKPFIKFERLLETYLAFAPAGYQSFRLAIPLWLKEKLFQKRLLRQSLNEIDPGIDWESRLLFTDHHQSHAASAFFPSPFQQAAVLTLDGVGEWTTTSCGFGEGNRLNVTREINFPHSIGLLYSAFTYYAGFKVNSGEYKLMGLAPYGEAEIHRQDLRPSGRHETGRLVPTGLAVFQLLHRSHHDDRTISRSVRRAAEATGAAARSAAHGYRRIDSESNGRDCIAPVSQFGTGNQLRQPLPCRRRRAQLCRKWKTSERRQLQENLDTTRGRRRRGRLGGRPCGPLPIQRLGKTS